MTKHHIVFAYSFNEGKAFKIDKAVIAEELKNDSLSWVHLDANDKYSKKWLEREVSYLDHLIIDALLAEETRPRAMEINNGLLIILREVNLSEDSQIGDMTSIRIWIDETRVITVQRRESNAAQELKKQIESGKLIKNSGEFLYNLTYQILHTTSPYLYSLSEKIDDLEERVITTHDIKFREQILQIRTGAGMFKRYLLPQREAISKLKASDCTWVNDWTKRHLQENYDQVNHLIEEVDEARERSLILHDELGNALTEKLNRSMYKLSLITLIFMPLTFLTGLFGINVSGIPGAENHNAFVIFVMFVALIALLQIRFFKKNGWF